MSDDIRPPIPLSLTHRPVVGGLAAPYVNLRLADGGVDFRSPYTKAYERCWREDLCQTCGNRIPGDLAVLFGGPNQFRSGRFDEPPLCPPCAVYATKACPMVAGRQDRYADRDRISQGHRGKTCPDPGCDCGGWEPTDPNRVDHGGDPAHAWYAAYVRLGGWAITVHQVSRRCSDGGCDQLHHRMVINGCQLTRPPLKVVEVSRPGAGRTWRRLSDEEIAALLAGEAG